MIGAKVCSLCRTGYRGLYILHAVTKGHQRKLRPTPPRTWTKGKQRAAAARRAFAEDDASDRVRVGHHRRRLPLDGQRKVVKVPTYWRGYAYSPRGISYAASRRRAQRRRGG